MRASALAILAAALLWGSEFISDPTAQTVTQSSTALMWQDDLRAADKTMSYKSAVETCTTLGLAAATDWRLPTPSQLGRIIDPLRTPSIPPQFSHTASGCYWTYGSDARGYLTIIDFATAQRSSVPGLGQECFVRCVRKIR